MRTREVDVAIIGAGSAASPITLQEVRKKMF